MDCDQAHYTDYEKLVFDGTDDVPGSNHLEFPLVGDPDGADSLHIFTGTGIFDFRPNNDDYPRRGVVKVALSVPQFQPNQFIQDGAACTAGLASIFNNDDDNDTTWAVDCVTIQPEQIFNVGKFQFEWWLVLVATVVVAAGAGTEGISRVNYQANVKLRAREVRLDKLLVSDATQFPPPFGPSVNVVSGQPWRFRLVLSDVPIQPVTVNLGSGSNMAPVPPSVTMNDVQEDFTAPSTTEFFAPNPPKDVTITASLGGAQRTATVTLEPNTTDFRCFRLPEVLR